MEVWEAVKDWFLGLGDQYGVNPLIFGAIYVGAIPLFWLCIAWIVRNRRRGKPLTLPVLATGLCLIAAYLYLLIAGENIPIWVWLVVAALIGYGAYSAAQRIRQQTRGAAGEAGEAGET